MRKSVKAKVGKSKPKPANRKRRYIPSPVRCTLWGKAAGRCQFYTCNKPVHRHPETKENVNLADLAHIIGFSSKGPRGEEDLSSNEANHVENLMLLCKVCHKTIDTNKKSYPVSWLREMKAEHEQRVEMLTAVAPDRASRVLTYSANVGEHATSISLRDAYAALVPHRFPADHQPVALGLVNSAVTDRTLEFWSIESNQLMSKLKSEFLPRMADGKADHASVFALAPQPLLMLLGYLLSDVTHADVYQLHREPATWAWQTGVNDLEVRIEKPAVVKGDPALVLALSAPIADDRVLAVVPDATIWRVTISNPHNDFLRSREQLQVLRERMRPLPDLIRAQHGTKSPVHVFPAMPVAAAVEFGRIIMPKAALDFAIYDENSARGGFAYALTLSPKPTGQRRS